MFKSDFWKPRSPIGIGFIIFGICSGLVLITWPLVSLPWYYPIVGIAYSAMLVVLSLGFVFSGKARLVISLLFVFLLIMSALLWAILLIENIEAMRYLKTVMLINYVVLGLALLCSVLGWLKFFRKSKDIEKGKVEGEKTGL